MVKHAAIETELIYTAEERIDRAMKTITTGKSFNEEQMQWLNLIREHLIRNLTIEMDDFDYAPIFDKGRAKKIFGDKLEQLVKDLNYAIAA